MVTLLGVFYLLDGKIERQGARTDHLYEMFIDLLKETRCPPGSNKVNLETKP